MATDAEIVAAGYSLPAGGDLVTNGDDAIAKNARNSYNRDETIKTNHVLKTDAHRWLGQMPDGANWDTFTTRGYQEWTKPGVATYLGTLPAGITEQGVLEVLRGLSTWTTMQRATESGTGREYVRAIRNPVETPPAWYDWQAVARTTDLPPAGSTSGHVALSADWLHLGDSLTDDVVLGPEQWCRYMGTLDGRAHEIRGWYNQESFEIAARAGATLYPVTVTGGSIPASGATVTVTGQRTDQIAFGGYAGLMSRRVPGWLHGRHGFLQNPTNAATMEFTADDGQTTATTATGTVYFEGDLTNYAGRIATVWIGTNDRGEESPDYLAGLVRQILARRPHSRALVFGLFSDPNGTYTAAAQAISDAYRTEFPDLFFDPQAPLMADQAFTDAGITKTAEDQADIDAGHVPRSFRSDSVHLNDSGGIALAHAVHREAVSRGWSI